MENLKVSESFRTAALKSNLKAIRRMMASYSSKNYGKELAWACAAGRFNVVKCLVENGANIEYNRGLPLYEAVIRDHISIVKYLVLNGAEVNSSRIPIYHAIENRYSRLTKYLLANGAIVYDDDLFIFIRAIQWGDEEIVTSIFHSGTFDQKALDIALWVAAEHGRLNLVKFLISRGVDPDNDNAIIDAFEEENYSVSVYLIDLALSKDPSVIKKYENYLTESQKKQYAEMLTATDFNLI